jgi:diguanylate cyclase
MELRRAGDVVPLHIRGAPIHDAEGNLAYAVAAFQDVRELHEAATRDPLTGLGNRRSLAQTFVRERLLQERAGGGLWLAVLDLDHFKRVNDEHGHAMGDAVLKRTAATLVRVLRRTDVVVRWGGEELVVVLPNVDLAGAKAAMDKALEAVRGESFVGAERSTFRVSFSAGVVMVQPNESLDSAVARADELLYAAKREGRNRVVAEPPTG